jgi:hypothetical protein
MVASIASDVMGDSARILGTNPAFVEAQGTHNRQCVMDLVSCHMLRLGYKLFRVKEHNEHTTYIFVSQ